MKHAWYSIISILFRFFCRRCRRWGGRCRRRRRWCIIARVYLALWTIHYNRLSQCKDSSYFVATTNLSLVASAYHRHQCHYIICYQFLIKHAVVGIRRSNNIYLFFFQEFTFHRLSRVLCYRERQSVTVLRQFVSPTRGTWQFLTYCVIPFEL